MWKDHKTLNRIDESISGWCIGKFYTSNPYYIRYNPEVEPGNSIEYTTEEQPKIDYPDELFMTSAGKITLYDEGEFGGHLEIAGKTVCQGNFSQIFEFKGSKYVIDSCRHMLSYSFRLIKVNENGTIEVIYDADQYTDYLDFSVGLDGFHIGKDFDGNEKAFFLCSGHIIDFKKDGNERFTDVKYLLVFDPENNANPVIKIDIPTDKVEFNDVSSIWTDGLMLAIGCDKEVVMLHLPDMSVEYWTELGDEEVGKILEEKHRRE